MISIVIPAHNERQNLSHLLPSLELNSNGVVFEVIVVLSYDSMDGSENMEVSSHISFVRCKDRGRAVQMNTGAALAKGTILAFLHADVKPPKTFLYDMENALREKFEAGFFSYQFDKKSFLLNINASFTGKDGIFTGGGDQCLFIERSTFDLLGKFNERQILMEDFEFFKRMKRNHIPYTIVNSDLIVSARKYETNSYLRVNLTNLLLVILFRMGLPSNRLKYVYNKLLNMDYQQKA